MAGISNAPAVETEPKYQGYPGPLGCQFDDCAFSSVGSKGLKRSKWNPGRRVSSASGKLGANSSKIVIADLGDFDLNSIRSHGDLPRG